MFSMFSLRAWRQAVCALLLASLGTWAQAHGDVTPQAVNTESLPQLGDTWLSANPYAKGPAHAEALRIGASAYNQNCARCHGLEAISGGIAPDLRLLDQDCMGMSGDSQASCLAEIDEYAITVVRNGRTRNGRVYMPPFEGILSQEAIWAIKTYLVSRRPE
jgi:cytochrome c-550 PedF